MTIQTQWQTKHFNELSLEQLYDLLKLRIDVFVVEQTCYYPDLDGEKGTLDRHKDTRHLLGYQGEKLVAYARVLPKGQNYEDYVSIGRVATSDLARGQGLGHELIEKSLEVCQQFFSEENVKISAQEHLKLFYAKHGFEQVSPMYLEDDIPHIAMLLNK